MYNRLRKLNCKSDEIVRMKKNFYLWLLAFILVSIRIEAQTKKTVWVGETFYCDATSKFDHSCTISNIKWTSEIPHEYVVGGTYNRGYIVTQYFEGTATIKCEWIETENIAFPSLTKTHQESHTWSITCISNPVSISPKQLELSPGETAQLSYSHEHNNDYTSYANAYFYVGNEESDIVSVSKDGKVEALKEGEAHVYVYSYISGEHPYCKVNVSGKKPTSISLPDTITMKVGETQKITPQFTPEDASSSLTWSTDNNSVAEISEDGVVTARNIGTATIKVVTANNLSASCVLNVTKEPEGIWLTSSENDVFVNDSITLTTNVYPSGATTIYTWCSDNEEVGIVIPSIENPKEALFIAKNEGVVNITVETENGLSALRTFNVKVYSTNEEIGKRIRKAQKVITEQMLLIREKFLK